MRGLGCKQRSDRRRAIQAVRVSAWAALAWLVGGCSAAPPTYNPVAWWHQLEGGAITRYRSPPPGADAPWPNLASVPARPPPVNQARKQQLLASLIAARASGQKRLAEEQPAPSRPSFTSPKPPPPPPGAAGASLAAGSAAPSAAKAPVPALLPGAVASPAGPFPPLPLKPPPPPAIPGVAPSMTFAPQRAPPRHLLLFLPFGAGSAMLDQAERDLLAELAANRGAARIAILARGGAASADPLAQAEALALALARARAIAGALATAGVPVAALSIQTAAAGRDATVRLLY